MKKVIVNHSNDVFILISKVAVLEQEIALLRRGGCQCPEPDFYWAQLISCYRCKKCGAVVSAPLLPDKLKPEKFGA